LWNSHASQDTRLDIGDLLVFWMLTRGFLERIFLLSELDKKVPKNKSRVVTGLFCFPEENVVTHDFVRFPKESLFNRGRMPEIAMDASFVAQDAFG
jgi:hypothetical protein